jgi:hypothetical protein
MLFEYASVRVGGGETAPGAGGTRKAEGGGGKRRQQRGEEEGTHPKSANAQNTLLVLIIMIRSPITMLLAHY